MARRPYGVEDTLPQKSADIHAAKATYSAIDADREKGLRDVGYVHVVPKEFPRLRPQHRKGSNSQAAPQFQTAPPALPLTVRCHSKRSNEAR